MWHQLEIDLGPSPADAADQVFTRMQAAVEPTTLWFVRKPPGLRLRVRDDARETEALAQVVTGLRDEGLVAAASQSVYEPEARRFGGARAMELVHAFFHVDTRAFIAWHVRRAAARLSPTVASLTVITTLFDRLLAGASSEIWDAWANLAALHGIAHRNATARPLPLPTIAQIQAIAAGHEAELLAAYDRGCTALADGIAGLRRESDFHVGLRAFAADVAMFHWNRWGLVRADRVALCEGALAALDPHRRSPCL